MIALITALTAAGSPLASPLLVPSPPLDGRAQLTLERLNAIRADPVRYYPAFEVLLAAEIRSSPDKCAPEPDLLPPMRALEPRPPLAPNAVLSEVATAHAQDMLSRAFFGHVNPDGVGPNERVRAAGVVLAAETREGRSIYRYSTTPGSNQVESLYRSRERVSGTLRPMSDLLFSTAIDSLLVDRCVVGRGHRDHLMGRGKLSARDREVGVGYAVGPFAVPPGWTGAEMDLTVLTVVPETERFYLTGVIYTDRDRSGGYSVGEGLAGIQVSLPEQGLYTITAPGGGYALPLPDDTAGVIEALGIRSDFRIRGENLKLDFSG